VWEWVLLQQLMEIVRTWGWGKLCVDVQGDLWTLGLSCTDLVWVVPVGDGLVPVVG